MQILQHIGECSKRPEWMLAPREIERQRILREYDIGDERRAYIRQAIADVNRRASGARPEMLRLAVSAACASRIAQWKERLRPIAGKRQLIRLYGNRQDAVTA